MTEMDKLYSILNDETNDTGVRLEALSRIKILEIKYMTTAATPEPAPMANNHPAIADIVAGELIAEHAPKVAADVMARKEFGMKKYGTPLQPFNGRDTLNDLYQELLDAMKYARVALYEVQYRLASPTPIKEAQETYEMLQELCISTKNAMEKFNGAANTTRNEAGVF